MARLNSRGAALWGVGGGGGQLLCLLTVDGSGSAVSIGEEIRAAICARLGIPDSGEGSGWFWVDDDTIAGQFCGDPTSPTQCSTWKWHIPTKTLSLLGQGANSGKGRGGSWAFWLGGSYGAAPEFAGVYSSMGYHSALGAVGDLFENGNLLALKRYQQDVLGFELISKGGTKLQDVDTLGQVSGVFCRGNVALYFDFGDRQLHALNAPNPISVPNVTDHSGPFAADSTGRLWMCDGQNGLLVRAWDSNVGYWLSRDAFSFWQDCVTLPNGKIRIVASVNQGETPGMQRVWDLDPLTGACTFNGVAGSAQLVDTLSLAGAPATLPPAPAHVTHTNPTAANALGDSRDNTELLLVAGVLALAWYFLE